MNTRLFLILTVGIILILGTRPLPAQLAVGYSNHFQMDTRLRGGLQVTITPQEAIDAGAQWRRVGTSEWRESGDVEDPVPAGEHQVEFQQLVNWTRPANQTVTVLDQETTEFVGYHWSDILSPIYPSQSDTGSFLVYWPTVSGATTYMLQRSGNGGVSWTDIYTGFNAYHLEEVSDGVYRYRLSVSGPNGTSDWVASDRVCVVADPVNRWAWMAGGKATDSPGIYGERGLGDPGNVPGGRHNAAGWHHPDGTFWLFGGMGVGSDEDEPGLLNDLWSFDPMENRWTWQSGPQSVNEPGIYTPGAMSIRPGGRQGATSWLDPEGRLWLFGGLGRDADGNGGRLNDLWFYQPDTGVWTWIAGSNTVEQLGVYGLLGAGQISNIPGARVNASGWADGDGNLWLFGGEGRDSQGSLGLLNDLWNFNPESGRWTWISGSSGINQAGIHESQGVDDPSGRPGARMSSSAWMDVESGTLWLFGGHGVDGFSDIGSLNDLWSFSPITNNWTWHRGSSQQGSSGSYGSLGVANAQNNPSARRGSAVWQDHEGNLWLHGGLDTEDRLKADLWKFNPQSGMWTWVRGPQGNNPPGQYGDLLVPNDGNHPGGRWLANGWTDGDGNLWMFGGKGLDDSGVTGNLNDMWRYAMNLPSLEDPLVYPTFSSTGSYQVSWEVINGATSFRLERSANSGASWLEVYSGSSTFYQENIADGNYRYRVTGFQGEVEVFKVVSSRDCRVLLVPEAPTTITYPAQSNSGVYTVSWTAMPRTDSYILQRSDDNGTSWQVIAETTTQSQNEMVTSGNYLYRVAGVNEGGLGPWREGSTPCVVRLAASRTLPEFYMPSVTLRVQLEAQPREGTSSWALEETPPDGWVVSSISGGGTWDGAVIRWGPFFGASPRTLTYDVTPPPLESGLAVFIGSIGFDGQSDSTRGDFQLEPGNTHPADTNVDWRLSITEVTAYGAAWRDAQPWPINPASISLEYVTNAAFIWRVGETYDFNAQRPAPSSWIPDQGLKYTSQPLIHTADGALSGLTIKNLSSSRLITNIDDLSVRVVVEVTPPADALVYAAEENIPAALTPEDINEDGVWDTENEKVKWGPFFDSEPRTFEYTLTGPSGVYTIEGIVSIDGSEDVVEGEGDFSMGETTTPTPTPTPTSSPTPTPTVAPTPVPSVRLQVLLDAILGRTTGSLASDENDDGILDAADINSVIMID